MKFLIIYSGGLGDVILLSPLIKLLKEKYNNIEIDLLLEARVAKGSQDFFSEALTNTINKIKTFDFKNKFAFLKIFDFFLLTKGYDCVISSGTSPIIALLLFFTNIKKRIGYKSKLSFLLTDSIKFNPDQYMSFALFDLFNLILKENPEKKLSCIPEFKIKNTALIQEPYILIHPGVSLLSQKKNIIKSPNSKDWIEIINHFLKTSKEKIILIGGQEDSNIIKEILSEDLLNHERFLNMSDKNFNIKELANLIYYSKEFICVDSAPMHLGVAVKANMTCLFGPTDPQKLLPPNQKNIKIIKVNNLLCQPCLWTKRKESCALPLCIKLLKDEFLSIKNTLL